MSNNMREELQSACDALEEIAMAGMSGTGQETEDGMRAWHARRAWEFIGIAARALDPIRAALSAPAPVALTPEQIDRAARTLAAAMDYPWEHMPAKGRDEMRKHARAVIESATGRVDQLSQGVLR